MTNTNTKEERKPLSKELIEAGHDKGFYASDYVTEEERHQRYDQLTEEQKKSLGERYSLYLKEKLEEPLTEEEKEQIREEYTAYLEREGLLLKVKGFGYEPPKPYIDRTPEEQQEIKDKYAQWKWDDAVLENWCRWRPEFSDPDFKGVFIDSDVPITNRGVIKWYEKFTDLFHAKWKQEAADCIDFMEQSGRVNAGYQTDTFNGRWGLSGWLYALAVMSEGQLSQQASHELRIQTEETQWGASIANALHDRALEIRRLAEEMSSLDTAYHAILFGRRLMDIEYLNEDGDFLHFNWFRDKMNTPANRQFLKEQAEEADRIRQEFWEKEVEEFDAWKAKRDEAIKEFEENTGLPVGVLMADCEYEEHY